MHVSMSKCAHIVHLGHLGYCNLVWVLDRTERVVIGFAMGYSLCILPYYYVDISGDCGSGRLVGSHVVATNATGRHSSNRNKLGQVSGLLC